MRVYDFLFSVAEQLGDAKPTAPFRRYTLAAMCAYYNEAVIAVAKYRPDLFTDYLTMKLSPGANQDARCCGCLNVTGLSAQVSAQGEILLDLTPLGVKSTSAPLSERHRWFRPPCRVVDTADGAQALSYEVKSWSIVAGMNGVFTVHPALPAGVDAWVQLRCTHAPPQYTLDQVNAGLEVLLPGQAPAIRSYVLYRALQGDRLAVGAATEAQNELKNFFSFLGVELKQEKLQEDE